MVDWKVVKKPMGPDEGSHFQRFGRSPCDQLLDNKFNHYVAQQNLYAVILADDYNMQLSSMWLCQLHKTHADYHMMEVPHLFDMARRMLNECASMSNLSCDVPETGADDEALASQVRASEKDRENEEDNTIITDVAEPTEPASKKPKLDDAGPNSGGQQDEAAAAETEAAAVTATAEDEEFEPWPNQIQLRISFHSALTNATKT